MVSIIIPVYNAHKYLRMCLDSCLAQTYDEWEIITVDDGSRDNSLDILREYEKRDRRIKVYSKPNEGLPATRQFAIERAGGEYLFFLDSDDTITVDAIEKLTNEAKKNCSDIVIGNILVVTESSEVIGKQKNYILRNNYLNSLIMKSVAPSLCGRLIRKRLFENIEFPVEYTTGEDVITNLLIAHKYSPQVSLIDDYIYDYIQHRGSMINTFNVTNANKRMKYLEWVDNFVKQKEWDSDFDNCYSKFILEEYFSFLRDGGKITRNTSINNYVNSVALENKLAVAELKKWRLIMLVLYKFSPILGNIYRAAFVTYRSYRRR